MLHDEKLHNEVETEFMYLGERVRMMWRWRM